MTKQKQDFKHIAIAGNIGSGKTTLANLLAKHYQWEPHFEEVESNPYINDFYEDMQRWSFHMQIYYLNRRFQQIMDIRNGSKSVIQDRTIYEDAFIFAPNLHDMGLMAKRDFQNYMQLFDTLVNFIEPPDLMIYLKASIPSLVNNIQKRGREFEDSIRLDYLKRLNERYEEWIQDYKGNKLLVVDVDTNDFTKSQESLGTIINQIEAERSGLI
ncbi:MAG: deoxynucleoside kinase [Bacteroidetes bacterium SW_10_40_5]|jgi:deoxyadenosine/deoxycytidine kinase|nr:MAG: deoxynucleoside kinase [Bacteroidetes bacterium SW_10_40_5]